MDSHNNKQDKKENKFPQRCHRCQYFNAKKDKCKKNNGVFKKNKDKCNTDFSQCDNFLIKESLIMY